MALVVLRFCVMHITPKSPLLKPKSVRLNVLQTDLHPQRKHAAKQRAPQKIKLATSSPRECRRFLAGRY
jgi:hypothetical protein